MSVNRDEAITRNLNPGGSRVDSIADRGNLFGMGMEARAQLRDRERECRNLSDIENRRASSDPGPFGYEPPLPRIDWAIDHASRRQYGPGGLAFDRGSVLPQPPNDRFKT